MSLILFSSGSDGDNSAEVREYEYVENITKDAIVIPIEE